MGVKLEWHTHYFFGDALYWETQTDYGRSHAQRKSFDIQQWQQSTDCSVLCN